MQYAIALITAFCSAAVFAAKSPYLLSLDFAGDTLGTQSVPGLEPLETYHDARAVSGTVDFGDSGFLQQEEFARPEGPFTVEALLRPREYAPQTTRFISDLANTATWDNGPNQGFIFRLGGGYLYPILPIGAYGGSPLYEQSQAYDNGYRAYMSRCLGEFAFATKNGGTAPWLEVFTDRCVDLGRWTHFTAVWDGQEARVYINGLDATDKWRRNGAGSQPFLNPTSVLTVGARYAGALDNRHFSGALEYIRILDSAMSDAQIMRNYLGSRGDIGQQACPRRAIPIAPYAGEMCDSACTYRFIVTEGGKCPLPDKSSPLEDGDSVEVEFSDEPDFANIFLKMTVSQPAFKIGSELRKAVAEFDGPCFWRTRLKVKGGLAAAKRSAADVEWSEPRPFLLSYNAPLAVRKLRSGVQTRLKAVAGGFLLEGMEEEPRIFRMDGRAGIAAVARGRGTWFLPSRGERGIYLMRTSKGVYRVAL